MSWWGALAFTFGVFCLWVGIIASAYLRMRCYPGDRGAWFPAFLVGTIIFLFFGGVTGMFVSMFCALRGGQ